VSAPAFFSSSSLVDPRSFQCPDLLRHLVPAALHCRLCRTAALDGPVSECACDFETVDAATHDYFYPLLTKLQNTSFFRFFKVHLDDACPFWDDSHETCSLRDCAVETCDASTVPERWRRMDGEGDDSNGSGGAGGDGAGVLSGEEGFEGFDDAETSLLPSAECDAPAWASASPASLFGGSLGAVARAVIFHRQLVPFQHM